MKTRNATMTPGPPSVDSPGPETGKPGTQRALTALALLALLVSALLGGNAFGARDRLLGSATPKPKPPAVSRQVGSPSAPAAGPTTASPATPVNPEAAAKPAATTLRSEPWWQGVGSFDGSGPGTQPAFTIDSGAIQWRIKWTCATGRVVVQAVGRPRPVVDAPCPGPGTGYSTQSGAQSLKVTSDGPWHLQIDQQVDVPLTEPPLAAMTAPGAQRFASGSFYQIDQSGSGNLTVYRLADGSYALRLDSFFVSPNIDLEIRFSPLDAPHSTDQYLATTPSEPVAPLDVTAGSLNFTVPAGIDPSHYRSVVIWCPTIRSAYAAATLTPAK